MTATQTDIRHLLPSAEEVAQFQRDGYYVSRPIYSAEELAAACADQDRFYAGERDHQPDPWDYSNKLPLGGRLSKCDDAGRLMNGLRALPAHPAIGAIAAALTGADIIRLWHDQLLFKPPAAGAVLEDGLDRVGWHTDRGYWRTCTSSDMLTAWVPFHRLDETHGPLAVVPGSHRWGGNDSETFSGNFFTNDSAEQWRAIRAKVTDAEQVVLNYPLGAVSFHHCRLIHGSAPNRSPEPRRSMAIHLHPGDNRWRRVERPDGSVVEHANDQQVRRDSAGHPDYTDPTWCPVLYPR